MIAGTDFYLLWYDGKCKININLLQNSFIPQTYEYLLSWELKQKQSKAN